MKLAVRTIAITSIALLAAVTSSFGQNKLGFVSTDLIIQQMPELKDIDAKLKSFQSSIQDTLRAMEINYKNQLEVYEKQKGNMNPEAKAKSEEQIRAIAEQYQQYQQDRLGPQGVLAQRQAQLLQPVKDKVRMAIEKVAKDESLSGVMEIGVMLYYDKKLEITYKVLDYINRGGK